MSSWRCRLFMVEELRQEDWALLVPRRMGRMDWMGRTLGQRQRRPHQCMSAATTILQESIDTAQGRYWKLRLLRRADGQYHRTGCRSALTRRTSSIRGITMPKWID